MIDDNPAIHDDSRKFLGAGPASAAALPEPEAVLFDEVAASASLERLTSTLAMIS